MCISFHNYWHNQLGFLEKYIDKLVDSTDNSANEKISRIREAFEKILSNTNICSKSFIPTGSKGELFVVSIGWENVIWLSSIDIWEKKAEKLTKEY